MGTGEPLTVVIFASYSDTSYEMFKALLQAGARISQVVFAPDTIRRLSWRKRLRNLFVRRSFEEPASLLRAHNVPFSFAKSHNGQQAMAALAGSDVLVLYGTNIIKEPVLTLPRIGVLNAHSSLLPKYRGSRAEFWMLYHGEPQYAGVTVHWVTPGLDDGDMFLQEPISATLSDTPESLRRRSAPVAGKLIAACLDRIAHGAILRTPQDPTEATRYGRPTEEDKREFARRRKHAY